MYCRQCGKQLDEHEQFCTGCGTFSNIYAGFWKRLFAYFLDFLILQGVGIIVGFAVGAITAIIDPLAFESEAASQATQARLTPILVILIQLFFWLYCATMESQKQATLGKMALGIKVTDTNGNKISFARASARHFAKILSIIPIGFGFFMVAFTDKKQGLHDIITKCIIVNR
jgi:uncharacterized RDD family membrane protein YckC